MPIIRKRRAQAIVEDDDNEDSTPTPAPSRRRESPPSSVDGSDYDEASATPQVDADDSTQQQMVKGLVRLALACEYSRLPIRRADISAKVLNGQSRQFRPVFEAAQLALRDTFGMEMVELPAKEKVTLTQRRAAQKNGASQQTAAGNKAWVLQSVLPDKFRTVDILAPPMVPTAEQEAAYVALYSFIISLIVLSGGSLAESRLERYLRRANADRSTPVDKTDKTLARMVKDGYISKHRDASSGEEVVEYTVGPRGKVEVGEQGVAGLVRRVYGTSGAGDGAEEDEELEKRLERSLKVNSMNRAAATQQGGESGANSEGGTSRSRGRGRGARQAQSAGAGGNDEEGDESSE